MTEKTPQTKRKLSRRDFLVLTGVAGGLYFGVTLGVLPYARLKLAEFLDSAGGPPSNVDAVPLAWFEIGTDDSFKIYIPKVEMGQGIHTTLAQAAAEELDVPWDALTVLNVGTGKGLDDPVGTSASNSTSSLFGVIRQAGATVREMLRLEGAKVLGLGAEAVVAENGFVTAKQDSGKNVSYGEIVQAVKEWQIPEILPALKKTSDFRYLGKAMPRVDLRDKVLGKTEYGFDVRLEGMLYGAVAMPAKIGATLKRAAAGDALSQPGVVKVILEEDFAGVVAERRDQAWAALGSLDLEWNEEKLWQQADIDEMIQFGNGRGVTVQDEGNVSSKLSGDVFEAEYFSPIAYHAHMEPQSAAADVRADGAAVWASTQTAVGVRRAVAKAIEMDEELVVVIPTFLGGGFGQKVNSVPAVQAARLSKAVGRPVHLGYRRSEDFQNGFVRPPSRSLLRAVVRENGLIDAIEHLQVSGQVAFPFLPVFVSAVMGADFGAYRGAQIRYGVPNKRVQAWMADLPMKTGWWRGLGLLPNLFAIESFMDELAVKVGMDAIDFRVVNLPIDEMGERMKKILEAVRAKSGWDLPAQAGRARGVALSYDVNTIVACVAEVSVEKGKIRVHKLTGAVDAGFFVNPDGAAAQMEGGMNMALSSALFEETTVRDGALTPINFGAYQFLNNASASEIVVELVPSGDKPFGMGEPPLGPVAPAVANAVFALTGQRLRKLPLKLA
ncbi:MAG: xanthine dehydrogenase family protein molybdopterin-binding subunit [Chloroflexi bacterium HGW-Chloroflexi-6]|nr:MAG: xanthine dehydrogenase family protein molybdopterin-binding subunit [Chloroflexi bacterium HGW-Chloroflexi-6]